MKKRHERKLKVTWQLTVLRLAFKKDQLVQAHYVVHVSIKQNPLFEFLIVDFLFNSMQKAQLSFF